MQDVAGHSDNGSMPSSRGQSLNNEANTHSLPGLLRARANSIDADEVERGSLLGRGCVPGGLHFWGTEKGITGCYRGPGHQDGLRIVGQLSRVETCDKHRWLGNCQ